MARAVRLKYVPDIHFQADPSFEQAARIDSLLDDPRVARDLGKAPDDEEPNNGA